MKRTPGKNFLKSPPVWLRYLVVTLVAFAAGHYSFFQLRSANAKISKALRPALRSEIPATHWAPADSEPSPLPAGTALVRDDGGAIEAVLLYFDQSWATNATLLFKELFKTLPVEVQVQVACADAGSIHYFEKEWGRSEKERGREVILLNAGKSLTIWARDRHLAAQGPLGKVRVSLLPAPLNQSKVSIQERSIPKLRLANGLVDRVGYIPFHLEGGNVASNGRHVFIGNNVLEHNQEVLADETLMREELESLFGRDVLFVRDYSGKVPHEHLDMYLTPIDERNVLVADLASGSKVLQDQDGRKPLSTVNVNPVIQRQLQEISDILQKQDYTVHRIPAVIHSQTDWMVTYNNCLMERRSGEKIVYMPVYRLPVLDKAAMSVYRGLGFRVETIDVSQVFRNRGALRCVVNVALRKPLPAVNPQLTRAK
jgi:hypothetical protein